ncbi:acetate kinase [Aliiruegeria haliotis]|uniref:Acetate kinase n=1 Tax=Aliiruegeria haliotis TaxID=1280846 RepID=A0A2T0RG19_9RHOB|nr:acetate kinase [Aliiruegeria haliotis]PRY20071.1 acetate kinase [Aliiruegeria haliotis]
MILTINCGSSSLKYKLYPSDLSDVLAQGLIERISAANASCSHEARGQKVRLTPNLLDQLSAFELMVSNRTDPEIGVIASLEAVTGIGHRLVHGGTEFTGSIVVGNDAMERLRKCAWLAPLHNPACIAGIDLARDLIPNAPNVAVFDTAFHQTLPAKAHTYALPYELCTDHGIRRFGFHGISCQFVSRVAAQVLSRPIEDLSMVVCHLGNGVTIDAVQGGRSVDTSLGFGTFSGIPMGTRSGDFDPAIVFHLVKTLGMSIEDVEKMCYTQSGLLGLSGLSNDMREILAAASNGDTRCSLALDSFVYSIRKTIGAYAAAMNGLDVLVFTAGIGENSATIRSRICSRLGVLGIAIDERTNEIAGPELPNITAADASVTTLVIPTDEERMIATEVRTLMSRHQSAA